MSLAITLIDETTSGNVVNKATLRLVSERVNLRDLLAQRIREEVDRFNQQTKHKFFQGLVQPTDTEKTLNGYKMRKPRTIDYDKQLQLAFAAFESNGFFVLVDNKQVENLDDNIVLREQCQVSFVKLVPLVGG